MVSCGSDGNVTNDQAQRLADRYREVIIWADEAERARQFMAAIPGTHGLRSPDKLDANDLLKRSILGQFLAKALSEFGRPAGASVASSGGYGLGGNSYPITSPDPAPPLGAGPVAVHQPEPDQYQVAFAAILDASSSWYVSGALDWLPDGAPDLSRTRSWPQRTGYNALYGQDLGQFVEALWQWQDAQKQGAAAYVRALWADYPKTLTGYGLTARPAIWRRRR